MTTTSSPSAVRTTTDTAELTTGDTKVYEAVHTISDDIAEATNLPYNAHFHLALNNVIEFDNRIPPVGFENDAFEAIQAAPVGYTYEDGQHWDDTFYAIPKGATKAVVTLYYQTTSKEYIEFLRDANVTDTNGQEAYDLWVSNGKSAPVDMDVKVINLSMPLVGDVNGDGSVNVDDLLLLLAAWGPCLVGCRLRLPGRHHRQRCGGRGRPARDACELGRLNRESTCATRHRASGDVDVDARRIRYHSVMPDVSLLEVFPTPSPSSFYIEHVNEEFTSVCPVTGHPDFGVIILRYVPGETCVELKSLKLYYQSFRNEGIYYEAVTNRIHDDLAAALSPKWIQVETNWKGRGGIRSNIIRESGEAPSTIG